MTRSPLHRYRFALTLEQLEEHNAPTPISPSGITFGDLPKDLLSQPIWTAAPPPFSPI